MAVLLRLAEPAAHDEAAVLAYVEEHRMAGEKHIHGSCGLYKEVSFAEWMKKLARMRSEETARGLVPCTQFLALEEQGALVGMINIRHRLDEGLTLYGGHIGYSVRPSRRRQGIAAEMLRLGLLHCRDTLGLARALVTCDHTNVASARTILRNHGVYDGYALEGETVVDRYWIDLAKVSH